MKVLFWIFSLSLVCVKCVDEALLTKAKTTYSILTKCIRDNPFVESSEVFKDKVFEFPIDAEEHYRDLLEKTKMYRNHPIHATHAFGGPWIENMWISNFQDKPLSYFNGMIPLFVQWVDIHANIFLGKHDRQLFRRLYEGLGDHMKSLLRPNVLYVTVSQDDEGITNRSSTGTFHLCPNILTLSAGGFGHIPIPLVKGELKERAVEKCDQLNHRVGFYGSVGSNITRTRLLSGMKEELRKQHVSYIEASTDAHDPRWMDMMANTLFNLAPRGFGRTSYRMAEIIQLGRIPVYMYNDNAWVPYENSSLSVASFGLVSTFGQSTAVAARVMKEMSAEEIEYRISRVRAARSHYTLEGVIKQIEKFLSDPLGPHGGELRCSRVPSSVLG